MEDNGSSILLIFQAPGIEEWKSGRPISSENPKSAGEKLKKAFQLLGRERADYNVSNAVQCFPGKLASSGTKARRDKSPPKAARNACLKWLREDISSGNYGRVVVFGRHAEKAVRELGYGMDARFLFTRHPTAAGVSIATLAKDVGQPAVETVAVCAA
jgi:uracil-DNA glycosylase family 4